MNHGQAQWGPSAPPPHPHGGAPGGMPQPPPGPGGYGQPYPGQYPGQYPGGHPGAYGAPMMGNPAAAKLDSDSNTWLLVAVIGFVAGFAWITGPLCWIKGGSLRRAYAALGMPASSAATGAYVLGIVSTILTVFAVVMVVLVVALWGSLLLL